MRSDCFVESFVPAVEWACAAIYPCILIFHVVEQLPVDVSTSSPDENRCVLKGRIANLLTM